MLVEMIGKSDGRNGGGSELERGDFCEYMYSEREGGREGAETDGRLAATAAARRTDLWAGRGPTGQGCVRRLRPPPAGWLRDPTPRNFHFVTLSTLKFIAI